MHAQLPWYFSFQCFYTFLCIILHFYFGIFFIFVYIKDIVLHVYNLIILIKLILWIYMFATSTWWTVLQDFEIIKYVYIEHFLGGSIYFQKLFDRCSFHFHAMLVFLSFLLLYIKFTLSVWNFQIWKWELIYLVIHI